MGSLNLPKTEMSKGRNVCSLDSTNNILRKPAFGALCSIKMYADPTSGVYEKYLYLKALSLYNILY